MKKTELHTNKRALCVIFAAAAVLLLCGAFCGAAAAFSPDSYDTAEELVDAIADPSIAVLASTESPNDTVKLTGDLILDKEEPDKELNFGNHGTVSGPKKIYLDLNGHILQQKMSASVIQIWRDTELVLIDSSQNTPHKFAVYDDGLWVLDSDGEKTVRGGVITGGAGGCGGGILIVNLGSRFTMNGGNIVGNSSSDYGGGVASFYGSELPEGQYTFTMNSGTIQGNVAATNGGGVCMAAPYDATYCPSMFMTGGLIANNTASNDGGGVSIGNHSNILMSGGQIANNTAGDQGGGVSIGNYSSMLMTGGLIANNTAGNQGGGIYIAWEPEETISVICGGTISENKAVTGGGIFTNAGLTLTNVKITGNLAIGNGDNGAGGGIFYWGYEGSALTIGDGVEITGNTAIGNGGGGIGIESYAVLNMTGGLIANNTANSLESDPKDYAGMGGGIRAAQGADVIISGGVISGNKAIGSSETHPIIGSGGGIAGIDLSHITLSGNAKITGNTAKGLGGAGVWIENGYFCVNGSPVVMDNTKGGAADNVYLIDYSDNVTLTGPFTGEIHITYPVNGTFGIVDSEYVDVKQTDADHFVPDTKDVLTAELYSFGEDMKLKWVEATKITSSPAGHGKITTFPRLGGLQNQEVTVIITPDAKYKFKAGSLAGTYTEAGETKEISFTSHGDNTYTFTMPGSPVTLTAAFTSTKSSKSQGTSVWLTATPTPEPTATPTAEPTPVPTKEAPTVKPITTQPTETPKSPVPLAGVLAGLGAAAVVFGLRRK